ncbi:MAG: hypothetical protein PWP71_2361 [Clostridia bacterium]|nr:hypothetical protein [Clostridia bacterium]
MPGKNFEYKSVRISASDGCLVMQNLIDLSLNNEATDAWELFTIFPHACSKSSLCLIAIFKRETRA